jgi:mannose-6-phosphate isomerase-like protein (cupin superfamily)
MVHTPFHEATWIGTGCRLEVVAAKELAGRPAPFGVSRFSLATGASSPLDRHEDSEIWLLASGSGTLSYGDGKTYPVNAGDILQLAPSMSHVLTNTGSQPILVFSIWWM